MSEQSTVVALLVQVMDEVGAVGKNERNGTYNFRGIDAVMNKVGPALRNHGVVVFPFLVSTEHEVVNTKSGAAMDWVRVVVDYTFIDGDGDSLTVRTPGTAFDAGDKAQSKAMSVAFRTALLQALCLPTGERDPDADVHELDPYSGPPAEQLADEAGALIVDATTEAELRAIWERYKHTPAGQQVTEMVKARKEQLTAAPEEQSAPAGESH